MSTAPSAPSPEGASHRLPPARPRSRVTAHPLSASSIAAGDSGEDAAYEVGYKKPPKHTQFQKGRSGNPAGRPKSAKGLKTIVRETMTAQVEVRTATGARRMSRMEAVMHKTVELAMKGNARAMSELLSLYAAAVPDPIAVPEGNGPESGAAETLTATDLAILESLRRDWADEGGAP